MAIILPDWRASGFDSGGGGSARPIEEVPQGPRNGTNRTFRLTHVPARGYPILLFLNGVYQNRFIVEYTQTGASITYKYAPLASDSGHVIVYWIGPAAAGPLNARLFAGGSAVVNYGSNAAAWNLQDMSCGIWVKFSASSVGTIIGYAYGGSLVMADNSAFGMAVSGSSGAWGVIVGHDYGSGGATDQFHTFVAGIPNGIWVYIGFTRDTTAKTYSFYLGDGTNVVLVETWTYTNNHNGGTSTNVEMQVGNNAGTTSGDFVPYVGSAEEHYVSSAKWTIDDHQAAMLGSPPSVGLVLNSPMGYTPEQDFSVTGASGIVTATTLVRGH